QRVTAVGLAYSARRVRLADVSRHVAVRAHAAERNRKQRLPYAPLKRRAVRRQRQIEFAPLAGKVLAELRACGGASARVARAGPLLAVEANLGQPCVVVDGHDDGPERRGYEVPVVRLFGRAVA